MKVLVDTYPALKVVVSGSAAAALRLKSQESGAGRFTDFLLPPVTFYEYLALLGQDAPVVPPESSTLYYYMIGAQAVQGRLRPR